LRREGHNVTRKMAAIFSRASPAHLAEGARKVLLRFESARHGDIKNPHLGRAQHFFSALDPNTQDKLMWCHSH
ncbi:MAG TPA: hypothetical protein VF749_16565, partial [Candidatus Acidoferrum sp.]